MLFRLRASSIHARSDAASVSDISLCWFTSGFKIAVLVLVWVCVRVLIFGDLLNLESVGV
jgi:hypothetical protein